MLLGKRLWTILMLMAALLLAAPAAFARDSVPGPGFDHFKTGFPLTGAHAAVRCEG